MVIYLALVINEKDGTVQFQDLSKFGAPPCAPVTPAAPQALTQIESTPAKSDGPAGPTESDVRTALLAAVKASDKATAVGVLETIAGVSRVPEVPEELRQAVVNALNLIVKDAANPSF